MLARDVQCEVGMTSKCYVNGVCLTLRYALLWTPFAIFASKLGDFMLIKLVYVCDKQIITWHFVYRPLYQPSTIIALELKLWADDEVSV